MKPYTYTYTPPTKGGRSLLVAWVAATTIAWLLGFPLATRAHELTSGPLTQGLIRAFFGDMSGLVFTSALSGALLGAVLGLASGIAQWLAFRAQGLAAGAWILSSLIGWAVGMAVVESLVLSLAIGNLSSIDTSADTFWSAGVLSQALLYGVLAGAILGVSSGIVQWLVLREHARKPALWLATNPLAWIITAVVFVLVGGSFDWLSLFFSSSGAWFQLLGGALIGILAGITTGIALLWTL